MTTTVGQLTSAHVGHQVTITSPPALPDSPPTVHRGELVAIRHTRDESWLTGEEKPVERVTWVWLRSGLPVDGAPKWKDDDPRRFVASVPVVAHDTSPPSTPDVESRPTDVEIAETIMSLVSDRDAAVATIDRVWALAEGPTSAEYRPYAVQVGTEVHLAVLLDDLRRALDGVNPS